MTVFLVAAGYGLVVAAVLYGAYLLYRRIKGQAFRFSWSALATSWLLSSVAILVLIFATWEGD